MKTVSSAFSGARGLSVAAVLFVGLATNLLHAQRPYGLDTSHWNGSNINWSVVYSNGYRFVFTKASESTWYTDDTLHHNMAGARAAGLLIGPYHFARPEVNTTLAGATNEANWFVSVAGQYMTNGYLRPVLDLETGGPDLGQSQLSAWANAFCNRVKQLKGVSPIIYCNVNYAQNYLNTTVTNWDLWIASWPTNPDPQNGNPPTGVWGGRWTFWQYAGDVSGVPGVPSSTDLNVFNGTLASLQGQIIGGGTNPPVIAIQPDSQTVSSNTTATFTVVAYGGGTLSYQWQKNLANLVNGGRISGATSPTLTISAVDGTDAGTYRCIVTNQYGMAISSNATLTVVASCDPNPLVNGNFEGGFTGGVANGWTSYTRNGGSGSWSAQTAGAPQGTYYQQVQLTSTTGGAGIRQNINGTVPGATYQISGWMRGNSAYAYYQVKVSPSGSTDWTTAVDLTPTQAGNGSTWVPFSGTVVAAGTNMTLWLDGWVTTAGKAVAFDAVTVTCLNLPVPVRIESAAMLSPTQFRLQVSGPTGGTLTFQRSSNLVDWVSVATVTNTGGTVEFTDAALGGASRWFYRVRRP